MGPPTVAQRLEMIEEKLTSLEGETKDMVTKVVDKAVDALRHSLTEVLMEGQAMAAKKKFQAEMKSTITGFQPKPFPTNDKAEGSVNRGERLFTSPSSIVGGFGSQHNPWRSRRRAERVWQPRMGRNEWWGLWTKLWERGFAQ